MSRTMTERGLRWLALSLALALAAGIVSFANAVRTEALSATDEAVTLALLETWEFLLFASVVPGFVGFWRVRQGAGEYGPAHARDVKRGTYAFVIGAAGALTLFVTGLVLGAVFVPTSTPFGWALRTAHHLAPAILAAFLGVFILYTVWRLGARTVRWLGLGALVLALFVAGLEPVVLYTNLPLTLGLPWTVWLGLQAVPSLLSLGLWLAACLLAGRRLRDTTPSPARGATAT